MGRRCAPEIGGIIKCADNGTDDWSDNGNPYFSGKMIFFVQLSSSPYVFLNQTIDPGDYQRTIRHTGYLEHERPFLTYSK